MVTHLMFLSVVDLMIEISSAMLVLSISKLVFVSLMSFSMSWVCSLGFKSVTYSSISFSKPSIDDTFTAEVIIESAQTLLVWSLHTDDANTSKL